MVDELTLRDVLQQMGARLGRVEDDVRGLRADMNEHIGALRAEMNEQSGALRAEMDWRFGRVTQLLVTVLLALVVGIGSLWLK